MAPVISGEHTHLLEILPDFEAAFVSGNIQLCNIPCLVDSIYSLRKFKDRNKVIELFTMSKETRFD